MKRLQIWLTLLSTYLISSPFVIDYFEHCSVDKMCYVLGSCISNNHYDLEKLMLFEPMKMLLTTGDCEVLMTVKPYTKVKYLITMRVKGKSMQRKKLSLSQGDKSIVNCEEKAGGMEVAVVDPALDVLNPTLYENLSHFDSAEAVCSFTIESPKELKNYFTALTTMISFDSTKYEYKMSGFHMLSAEYKYETCDPDSMEIVKEVADFRALPIPHKARLKLDCSHYNDPTHPYDYRLFIKGPDLIDEEISMLECDTSRREYKYKSDNDTEVFLSESFGAYCGVELNKMCKQPDLNCGDRCPQEASKGRNAEVKYECPGGKWLMEGEYYEGIDAVCKGNEEGDAVWIMVSPDGEERPVKEGRCFHHYDCKVASKLEMDECDGGTGKEECGEVKIDERTVKCASEDFDLIIYSDSSALNDTTIFECDPQSGLYRNASDPSVFIPMRSRVLCRRRRKKGEGPLSGSLKLGISVGAGVLAMVIAFGLALLLFFLYTKRNRLRRTMNKEKWMKMPPSEKITEAQMIFGKAGMVGEGERPTLLDALKLLHSVVESESEEVELWESIKVFLKRLQAVAHSQDYGLERVINRYCYLLAKKIIDKHGWISPSPVTKSNPSGYIRVGAIYLLATARRDVVEAQEMILEGFKKLRFDAVDQYPHCGLLWSIVTQQRVKSIERQEKLVKKLMGMISPEKFLTRRGKLCTKEEIERVKEENKQLQMTESDQFDHFGSVMNQCSYAVATSDLCDNFFECAYLISHHKDLANSVIKGVLDCPSGNTIHILMKYFGLKGCGSEEQLNDHTKTLEFREFVSTIEELEEMMTVMAFERRLRDARSFEKRFDALNALDPLELVPVKEEVEENLNEEEKKETIEEIAKRENMRIATIKRNPPCNLYSKVKDKLRVFVASLKEERKDIHDWMSEKMGKNEVKKAEKSEGRSENGPISHPEKEEKEGKEEKDGPFDVDEFVAGFHREERMERIRKCPVDEYEQAKLRSILNRILDKETILGVRVPFSPLDVMEVCERMKEIIRSEPMLIEDIPAGITVVADLHGQLYDLARIFDANAKDGRPGYESDCYIFTGDYVDRGDMSLEVAITLFILKILYPDRFWILRGNHETVETNRFYGFPEELEERYEKDVAMDLYSKFTETFMYLSIGGIIGGQILCVHGGISAGPFSRHELRLLRKPFPSLQQDLLVLDMAWSDPAKGMEGYFFNHSRSTSIYFGEDVLQNALDRIGCSSLIRGHSMLTKGFNKFSPVCLPIFTATAVDSNLNNGAFVRIFDDLRYQIVVLKYDQEREAADMEFYDPTTNIGKKKLEDNEITRMEEDMGNGEIMSDKG